jgi:RNA polymerase sigma factor (TIGR02999 family)
MAETEAKQAAGNGEVGEITRILQQWSNGERQAMDNLMPLVVNDLRHIARRNLGRYSNHGADHTLQATALVNEAYLKLRNSSQPSLRQRTDFYALCAEIIKNIMIDYARKKNAARRGGGAEAVSLDETVNFAWVRDSQSTSIDDVFLFEEMLGRLEEKYGRESQVLGLKYYVGLTDEEIARSMGIAVQTVRRDLTLARAWVRREVSLKTSEIFNRASGIGDASRRKAFLDEACAGNEGLRRDVELLLRKEGKK